MNGYQEMQALARLNHPHIVQAYDADRAGDSHFLIMELVHGESLESMVKRCGPLPPTQACELIRQAAIGLQHAHENGLVHRDIKPGNLLLSQESRTSFEKDGPESKGDTSTEPVDMRGVVKIADFGLARLVDNTVETAPGSAPPIVGTPEYMAPEQARNPEQADIRADLYSLGCTFYLLLTGHPPFTGLSPLQTILAHQEKQIPPIPGLPLNVAGILDRLLAKDPSLRFAEPKQLIESLTQITMTSSHSRPAHAKNRIRWLIAACGLALVVAGIAFFPRQDINEMQLLNHNERDTGAANQPVESSKSGEPYQAIEPVILQRELAPTPRSFDPLQQLTTDQLESSKRSCVTQMLDWMRINGTFGSMGDSLQKPILDIEKSYSRADTFMVAISGQRLQTQKDTLLIAQLEGFHKFELNAQQVRAAALMPNWLWFRSYTHKPTPRRKNPRVILSDVHIDNADSYIPGTRIEGTLRCDFLDTPKAGDHLQISHHLENGPYTHFYQHYPTQFTGGSIKLSFSANAPEPRLKKGYKLIPLFFEWMSKDFVAESHAAAALIAVRPDD